MDLRLKVQLTAEDYAAAQALHGRKVAFYYLIFLSTFSLGMVFLIFSSVPDPAGRIGGLAAAIATVIAAVIFRTKGIAVRTKRLFAQQKSLHHPCEIGITDAELTFTWAQGTARVAWGGFRKWRFNEKVLLLYQTDMQFIPFPRRFFASEVDFQAFKNFLKMKLGPAGQDCMRLSSARADPVS